MLCNKKNKKNSHIFLISPFTCSFSFSPIKISITAFSAPIGASVFKFCVHLQVGKVLFCVNENEDANPHFTFFFQIFNFSFCHSYITHMDSPLICSFFFLSNEISVTDIFSALIGASVFKFCVHLQVGKMYCVNEN